MCDWMSTLCLASSVGLCQAQPDRSMKQKEIELQTMKNPAVGSQLLRGQMVLGLQI